MKEQPSNPCEKVSFILTYDQLEAAYNIYREQFISCDFIRRSMERLEERIGPVSYTHLDVYKRQIIRYISTQRTRSPSLSPPVSYVPRA